MFAWLRSRLQQLASWTAQKQIERLTAEGRRLKADLIKANGGRPIRITPGQRRRLDEVSRNLDPKWVEQHTLFADAEVVEDDDE